MKKGWPGSDGFPPSQVPLFCGFGFFQFSTWLYVQKTCYSDISFVYRLGARPGIVKALEEFKLSVYGENYEEDDAKTDGKAEPSRKRKANAMKEYSNYDWSDLADNGKVTFSSL